MGSLHRWSWIACIGPVGTEGYQDGICIQAFMTPRILQMRTPRQHILNRLSLLLSSSCLRQVGTDNSRITSLQAAHLKRYIGVRPVHRNVISDLKLACTNLQIPRLSRSASRQAFVPWSPVSSITAVFDIFLSFPLRPPQRSRASSASRAHTAS